MAKRIWIALLFGVAAYAQTIFPSFPPQLKEYLGLANEQAGQIAALNNAYYAYAAGKQQRMAQVQREISEETAKDPLDPMALGVRYAEQEAIRRDLADRQGDVRQKAVALLTDPQRARLKSLDDASKLQLIIAQAQSANLIDTPLVSGLTVFDPYPSNIIPASRISPFPVLPPDLKTYLGLTDAQAETITRLSSVYQQDTFESTLRTAQLQRQIQNETAKETIDPMALGSLYAELEYMQRDLRRERTELRKNILIVLSDAQRAKLNALDAAQKLQPRVSEAVCENLLASPLYTHWFDTTTFVNGIATGLLTPGCQPPTFEFSPAP